MYAKSDNYHLYLLPPKEGRYIVFDVETSGLKKDDHILELCAYEILNGIITGESFHIYITPRKLIPKKITKINGISNDSFDGYYSDCFKNTKRDLKDFLIFLGNSLLFSHNSTFDSIMLNNELVYWGLPPIETKRFRCTMRIFKSLVGKLASSNKKYKG